MELSVPEVRVGEPMLCGGLAVSPLFAEPESAPDYLLACEAMAAGTLTVREVSEEGSVSELLAVNDGDEPVLFLEGEEMRGAKQNRGLCMSVLVGGRSRTTLPVSCVERGRWEYLSPRFAPGSCCPPTLRHLLKLATCAAGAGRFAGQASLWQAIRRKHGATATRSERENLSDTLDTHRDSVEALRRNLPYVEGSSGIAVAIGGKVVSVDLFDKPTTLQKLWDRLADGIAIDALEICMIKRRTSGTDRSVKLYMGKVTRWRQVETVGLGEAYRSEDDGTLATALVKDDVLLHLSLSVPIGG
jgi:hypothetical protein